MIISVDFDGTLALGDTSDIPSMKPNLPLISVLNEMFKDGNQINIVTARGSKSCNSFEQRKIKYQKIIEEWLKKNKVKYHKISFFKEYGDIYFDDKSINIKDTIRYEKLDSIFTKNKVRRLNEYVVKSSSTSKSEFSWYKEASKFKTLTAKVLSYDQDTITTEYISGERFNNPILAIEVLKNFKKNKPLNNNKFSNYVDRIKTHVENNNQIINGEKVIEQLNILNLVSTFNHGDFSIDNMIQKDNKLYLIDPIYSPRLFQSYFIDAAKHLFTILYYDLNYHLYDSCRKLYEEELDIPSKTLDILICSESIRVATYKNQLSSISNNLIDSL